jgi:hypothetical protein
MSVDGTFEKKSTHASVPTIWRVGPFLQQICEPIFTYRKGRIPTRSDFLCSFDMSGPDSRKTLCADAEGMNGRRRFSQKKKRATEPAITSGQLPRKQFTSG